MKRYLAFALIVLGLLTAVGCEPGVEEAQVDFCQALDNYGEAVDSLKEINEHTTLDELNQTREEIAAAREELLEAAGTLRSARIRYTEDAWQKLESQLDGMSGETTLGEAANFARIETATLLTEIDRVYNTSCGRR